jgi:hypothetical protein
MARRNMTPLVLDHPYLPVKLSEEGDVFVAGVWLHRPDVISVQGHVIKVKALMREVFG